MEKDKEHILIEDLWTKLFAFHLGAQCPNKRKVHILCFIRASRTGTANRRVCF